MGFADIFESNALQNGLLAIELDEADWQAIADAAREHPAAPRSRSTFASRPSSFTAHADGSSEPVDTRFDFEIPEAHRHRLLHGLDSIGETLLHDQAISRHEQSPSCVGRDAANLELNIDRQNHVKGFRCWLPCSALLTYIVEIRKIRRLSSEESMLTVSSDAATEEWTDVNSRVDGLDAARRFWSGRSSDFSLG